ncbi:hypothetical protein PVAG01_06506 [Phlyctema vagabunda]|uniref:Transcriptional regulator n=1 Tax=Phlyctema vagabunda TaxID=108571 RepID=A0ABR4PGB7_9HELO
MYLRAAHAELSLPVLYEFIKSNPLGVLTTALSSTEFPLLQSTHLPWVLDVTESPSSEASNPVGSKLRGHLARVNPHAKALVEAAKRVAEDDAPKPIKLKEEVMILFTSSVNHYVTPKFYVKTKPSTGKVVPTWDYAAVQAYGTATIYFDPKSPATGAFLSKQIDDLSRLAEEDVMGYDSKEGRPGPWSVDDAPSSYVELLKKAILGIEIDITRLAGKWKMSQELGEEDREGTINGFKQLGTPTASEIAKTIEQRGNLKSQAAKK